MGGTASTIGGAPVVPAVQHAIVADIAAAPARQGNAKHYPMCAWQGIGIVGFVPSAAAVVEDVVAEAENALKALATRSLR